MNSNETSKVLFLIPRLNNHTAGDISKFIILISNINCLPWIIVDSFLFLFIISGNILTILAITLNRKLRSITCNYFVLSLALSDLLVGLSLPYHIAFYIDNKLSTKRAACILRFVIISLACGGSIYNLVAISLDRYIAVVYPLKYSLCKTKRLIYIITIMGWVYTINVATIPFYWNIFQEDHPCELENVFSNHYTLAIIIPSFSIVWLSLLLSYCKIYKEARMHVDRLRKCGFHVEKAYSKSVQEILLVLGCFTIFWLPYLIVITIKTIGWYKDSTHIIYKITFSLALANSGMNPMIYAWKNKNFRKAFMKLIRFQSPNTNFNFSVEKYLRNQQILKVHTISND
ncbi:histamine H2 receptor-like [Prorops nasuta]|uniref:histamine H2 receptor-like n=1 Tax=Prorops nasuta TaxID=863751 RepID=UPI0034CE6B95